MNSISGQMKGLTPHAVELADNNLMKAVLAAPQFSLLEELRSSSRLHSFEQILMSPTDEDEDYRWILE